jgi:1-deoxy-D-xylulose-5-phosphate synthase
VFDAEQDLLIWDVGHQAHAHKILTGRRDSFHTLRLKGGLSGYPRRAESRYDPFGTGHSSTSISAGLGMAVANDHRKKDGRVVAIIGDGALTGGMAYEALSHAGHLYANMLVVLNDNDMAISKNVGALSSMLSRLITGGLYNRAKGDIKTFMEHTVGRQVTHAARRVEHSLKGMIVQGTFFEELGFRYIGPCDGNDIPTLVHCLQNIKDMAKPMLFHCVTRKGKGYSYAEEDPLKYHGVKPDDVKATNDRALSNLSDEESKPVEAAPSDGPADPTFTDAFTNALIEAAETDESIVAITAAMPTGTGLSKFEAVYPGRFYDVGICEQHAVTFAAGLATQGMRPVAAIYSTFLQRGYDQYIHDVCLQDLPVVFAVDRAGLVGEDSPTQQGAYDLSFMRAIPNVIIVAPRDDVDTRLTLRWAFKQSGPVAIRYARGEAPTIDGADERNMVGGEILRKGSDGCFLAVGPVLGYCMEAAEVLANEGYSIAVADARFVKPLDGALLDRLAELPLITVEENTLEGGFGSAVMEYFERHDRLGDVRIKRVGLPDRFLEHATRSEQLAESGLDTAGLTKTARQFLSQPLTSDLQPAE